jgi:hypothetical protein
VPFVGKGKCTFLIYAAKFLSSWVVKINSTLSNRRYTDFVHVVHTAHPEAFLIPNNLYETKFSAYRPIASKLLPKKLFMKNY